MHAKDPTKLRVRDLQPMVRKYSSVPSNTIPQVSLTVFVLEYGAEESAAFQVTPHSKLPRLTLFNLQRCWKARVCAPVKWSAHAIYLCLPPLNACKKSLSFTSALN